MSEELPLLSQEELLKGIKKVNRVKRKKSDKNTSASGKKPSKSGKRTAKKR